MYIVLMAWKPAGFEAMKANDWEVPVPDDGETDTFTGGCGV
jgi:hypothetical protein